MESEYQGHDGNYGEQAAPDAAPMIDAMLRTLNREAESERAVDRVPDPEIRKKSWHVSGHRFAVGDIATVGGFLGSPREACRICRLLPADTSDLAELQYRIKALSSGHERVVKESQLFVRPKGATDRNW